MSPIRFLVEERRAETELLIRLSRQDLSSTMTARVLELFRGGVDWDYLLLAAQTHATLPLVYSQLSTKFAQMVPAETLGRFREQYQANAKYALLLTREMLNVVSLLRSEGIEAIPFKGPMLAYTAYKDPGLRQFLDLDLLVHKEDVSRVRRLLASHSYVPQFYLTGEEQADLLRLRCEECFMRDDLCAVDLHWGIVPTHFDFAPKPEAYWQRTRQVCIGGSQILTLSPEDLLLFLCIHGAKHHWKHLNWICDLAAVIRANPDIVWPGLIAETRAAGSGRMLLLGLYLVNDLLEERLPEIVLLHLRNEPRLGVLAESVYRRLFRDPAEPAKSLEEDLFFIKSMVNWPDRLRLLAIHIRPTPWEWKLVPLPRSLRPLYYAVRPLRLAAKFAGRLFKPEPPSRAAI